MLGLSILAAAPAAQPLVVHLGLVLFIIFVALVFDFLNGFHDAANSIATIVATRVLTPAQAVVWAAFFNFLAAFFFEAKVAGTVAKGLVDPHFVDVYIILGGLTGAVIWNIITWLLGLPTSSSHALVAGIGGAAVAKMGFGVILWKGWIPLLLFIVLSPAIGFILGTINMVLVSWAARRATPHRVDSFFRRMQLVSAAIYSLGHGGNDAQKTMGIIVLLLGTAGLAPWAHHNYRTVTVEPAIIRTLKTEKKVHVIADTPLKNKEQVWLQDRNDPKTRIFVHHNTRTNLVQEDIPSPAYWIVVSCFTAIAMGTMFGGWRIVKTMGCGITRLAPVGGFCAETAAATTIIIATNLGIPISTTHAITGSILGVGTTRGVRYVRWIWGQRIIMAWILTIPCSAFMAAVAYLLIHWTIEPFFPHY